MHGAYTSLGVGAMVDRTLVPGYARSSEGREPGPNVIFVRFREGVDHGAAMARLRREAPPIAEETGNIEVLGALRPAEIVNASDIGASPTILAAVLVFAALASLALTLGSSVRRRRHDLALLKTLGFTRRQLAATVRWQASVTVVAGLVVGVPLGVIAGRWLWEVFARDLDVVPDPSTPFVLLLVISALALVVGILAAAVPAAPHGGSAPRHPPLRMSYGRGDERAERASCSPGANGREPGTPAHSERRIISCARRRAPSPRRRTTWR